MSKRKILTNDLVGQLHSSECLTKAVYRSLTLIYKTIYADDSLKKWPFQFAIFACIQFFFLTALAIVLYPGGTIVEPTGFGYAFFRAFYSELGMTVTMGGKPNTASALIFAITLTVIGLGISIFYVAVQRFFREPGLVKTISIAGSVFGAISGISCIGVALTPANISWETHFGFALLACQTFLLAILSYTVAIFKSKKYPKAYGIVYILFAVFLGGYIYFWLHGRELDTAKELIFQATMQKVMVLSTIICNLIQNWGAIQQEEE